MFNLAVKMEKAMCFFKHFSTASLWSVLNLKSKALFKHVSKFKRASCLAIFGVGCLVLGAEAMAEQQTLKATQQNLASSLNMQIDGQSLSVTWEKNAAVDTLVDMAKHKPITVHASPYGGFEQSGALPKSLPSDDRYLTSRPGDIFLYQGRQFVVFFGENSWSYTKLGHIENLNTTQLKQLLNQPETTITLFVD